MTHVLILGSTGYIGGLLLTALKAKHGSLTYTALVRTPASVPAIESLGVTCVVGTSAERDKITALAAQADIVINAANSDDLALIEALLAGLRQKKEEGRGTGTLLHTSGALVFLDGSKEGKFNPDGKVFDDGKEEDIKAITPAHMHGPVDTTVLQAGEQGFVNTFIVCPTYVYGARAGPTSKSSFFYKFEVSNVLSHKQGWVIGEGTNVVGTVHVKDLVDLYLLIFNAALNADLKPLTTSAYTRYYVANARDLPRKDIARVIADVIYKQGLISTPDIKHVGSEEAGDFAFMLGANMLSRGTRALELGWVPKGPSLEETIEEGIKNVLQTL
ncbi:hypothetical protein M0805_005928 [Coniferiporia weirii]|nr:hypothetical protein M0805_005928 [Coniferiporia weirii]